MKRIIPFLVLILVLTVVGISGCTDNSSQNKTFNKSGLYFQYPGNWSNNANITWTSGAPAENETIGTLGNGNITLAVLYINMTKEPQMAGFDIESLKNLALMSWNSSSVKPTILSDTNRQVNNKTAYEIIYMAKNPVNNGILKDYYVIIGEKGKSVYILRFDAPESEFATYYQQFRDIVSSVQF